MPPKQIIELQQYTLKFVLEATEKLNKCIFEDTWGMLCEEFVDASIIFNAMQWDWILLENHDGDELSACDTETMNHRDITKLLVQALPVRRAQQQLAPMNLHSAVYTFSCFAEGHVGMQIEKSKSVIAKTNKALDVQDLQRIKFAFEKRGSKPVLHTLKTREEEPDAFVLHVPSSDAELANKAFDEMKSLGLGGVDTTFLNTRRNKVMNKLARYNFNIGDRHQNPDIANGKNTLYSFEEMPCARRLRQSLSGLAGKLKLPQMKGLLAEANLYYNDTCGIRYHGDEERPASPVIGMNFGTTRYLDFQSFYRHAPLGPEHRITLNHGDIYFMSKHAVGLGWCKDTYKRAIFRHRAGSMRFLMKHDKELEARARRKLEKRAKKKQKVEAQREAVRETVLEAEAPVTLGRIAGLYNDPALLCHGCNRYQRQLQNLVWYDTAGDGEQYCFRCDAKNKENKEQ